MKIKDILKEGFWSDYAKGLLPQTMQDIVGKSKKPAPDQTDLDLAKAAYKKFGEAPPRPKDSKYGYAGGEIAWLSDEQIKAREEAAKIAKQEKEATAKAAKDAVKKARSAITDPSMSTPMDSPSAGAANIPKGHRISVQNPQRTATFYKYPDGRWTDEFGNSMPSAAHGALEQFADTAGRMEQIPVKGVSGFKPRGAKRAR